MKDTKLKNRRWSSFFVLIGLSILAVPAMLLMAGCTEIEEKTAPISPDEAPESIIAIAEIHPLSEKQISGTIRFIEQMDLVKISGTVDGLPAGKHGFHVHSGTSCDNPGDHYNPESKKHGAATEKENHTGDLGNLVADSTGKAQYELLDADLTLSGSQSVIGKALIIHLDEDKYSPQPSGDSGEKIGCGIIKMQDNSR